MKKLLCILLSVVMVLPVFCLAASAATTDYSNVQGVSNGCSYVYRDSYFAEDASVYNPSLSTMSYLLAKAGIASSSNNWSYQYRHLFNLFGNLGFTDFDVNEDYKQYPGTDTMGVGMAHKKITLAGKTYTLLAIVPRSANYEAEWANNFTLGLYGDAKGFSDSAAKVEAFVNEYVETYGSHFTGEIKLWIVGYSRGAAVANLTAGRLTQAGKVGSFNVTKENIFAYTFETPRGLGTEKVSAAEAKTYTNIHNIISSNDLVTKVAPSNWGFRRYGTDESVIPETRTEENSALFDFVASRVPDGTAIYNAEGQRILATETFQAKKLTSDLSQWAQLGSWVKVDGVYQWQFVSEETAKEMLVVNSDKTMGAFLDDLISALCLGIGSRVNYVFEVQDLVRLVMSESLGSDYQSKLLLLAETTLKSELQANAESLVLAAVTGNLPVLENILTAAFDNAIAASGFDVSAYGNLPVQIAALIPILAKTLAADALIDGGSDILTLIDNLDVLFYPHEGSVVFAWLQACDPNYNPNVCTSSAVVTDVLVNVEKFTETKKILFVKAKVTSYRVTITPVSDTPVKNVAYRTILIGSLKDGDTFVRDINLSYLYVAVTDANGNVTHWEYQNGKVKKAN